MNVVIANAFSLNMLQNAAVQVEICPLTVKEAQLLISEAETMVSVVGHKDVAEIMSNVLGTPVAFNRSNFIWKDEIVEFKDDEGWEREVKEFPVLLVGQYSGPRLPEGTSVLPEGATIQWWQVAMQM